MDRYKFDTQLRHICHQLRGEIFKKNKDKAIHWTIGLMGTPHISELDREKLLIFIGHLISKKLTGHSIKKREEEYIKLDNYFRKKIKVPFTKFHCGIYLKKENGTKKY